MNRNDIVSKSAEIVNAEGIGELTISRLAREFNIKPPSLYNYVKSLNDIHDELGILAMQTLVNTLQNDVFGLSGDHAIRIFAEAYRNFGKNNPGLYAAMQLTHVLRGEAYQAVAGKLLNLTAKLLVPYDIKNKNRIHAMRNFRCLIHGFIDLENHQGFGLPEDIEKSFGLAVEGFILNLKKIY